MILYRFHPREGYLPVVTAETIAALAARKEVSIPVRGICLL